MLRLLEVQLREELEQLQSSYARREEKPKVVLTKCMHASLRNECISVETMIEQPLCPICSEDYEAGECLKVLPCKHYFHGDCVMPWLEMKKTCPICRLELQDKVPPIAELEKLSVEELEKHFEEHDISKPQGEDHDRETLVKIVHNFYVKDQEENEKQASEETMGDDPWRNNRLGRLIHALNDATDGDRPLGGFENGGEGEGEGGTTTWGDAPSVAGESQMRVVRRPLMMVERDFDRHFPVDPNLARLAGSSSEGGTGGPTLMTTLGGGSVPVNRTFILRSNGPNGSASVVPVLMTSASPGESPSPTIRNTTPADSTGRGVDGDASSIDMVD